MKITKEVIEILTPEHGRTSCSDDFPQNGYPNANGYYRCNRCALLRILENGYGEDEVTIDVSVSVKSNR